MSKVMLNNGVQMPQLGLGVYRAEEGKEVENAVSVALEAGYRSIDTAVFYGNEAGVGRAVRDSEIPRNELFITTKVWNDRQGYEETLRAFEESREKLGLEVVDLYLIHWPVSGKYKETWRALEKLYDDGSVRAIGVSNFNCSHLEDLLQDARYVPQVNQVEFHPYLVQNDLLTYCREKGIQLESWRPLTRGDVFVEPVIQKISQKYEKTPAQVVLRWHLQHGLVTIPKSVTPARIRENADLFDFSLTADEVRAIDGLNQNRRFGPDPADF